MKMTPQQREGRFLLAPLVAFLLVFLSFPALVDIVYSLSDVTFQTMRAPEIAGLRNFSAVLADPEFWAACWFSLRFGVLTAVIECGLGLALAIFLSPIVSRHGWTMAILMLPMMVAPSMVGLMYRLVLHEFAGPLPYYMVLWFGTSPAFLDANNAFWTLVVVEVLQWTPFAFLLFHVAYISIPSEIREAAAMDRAKAWKILWRIELPMMKATIAIALGIRFIDGFRVFDNVFALTGAGAGGSTMSLSIYIYHSFFKGGQIGAAVAASALLFFASLILLYGAAIVKNHLERRRIAA
ncbi:ABC transporter permease subunit [Sinorhizobium medicae]|uniref:carbohydrate ABC transporter permease n=1 Tax=Sinorhizobium medicae TaxID=110321 RepID=UPI000FDBA619|nr:sugar ABC transporter permease [Sinorhizobium medicae]MDX0539266.1 ABC transporter permease subunit [Sinorhizobium medicae]MDX0994540.1 ABC transporter permease subunit [Sinorhizobium medicae]MDX1178400.1 ABC transporter permease subunit [Sinorhizobium medicae]MQY00994.1 ABC transporter permease subunit [Sinorhizobium medicae]RVI95565.1 sugar ABC transporter permease [Sinorhizobium medicae]